MATVSNQDPPVAVQLRFTGDVQRMELKDGDALVLTAKGKLTRDQADHLREYVKAQCPGHYVIVLDDDLTLQVASHDAAGGYQPLPRAGAVKPPPRHP